MTLIKILDNAKFFGKTILGEVASASPTYAIGRSLSTVDEGSSVVFTLSTTNVANGTVLPYTISGISSNDVTTGSLAGSFTVSDNLATTTITMSADQLTEGAETATLTLNNGAASNFVVVNDTSVWTPAIISGLQLWMDASDTSTLFDSNIGGSNVTTNSTAIGRWQDKTGNGRNFIQATSNNRPILLTNQLNSKPVISFDGINDVLASSSSTTNGLLRGVSGISIFAVRKTKSTVSTAESTFIAYSNLTTTRLHLNVGATDSSNLSFRRINTDANTSVAGGNNTATVNSFGLYEAVINFNSAVKTASNYKNGTLLSENTNLTSTGSTAAVAGNSGIGGAPGGSLWADVDIAEIIIYGAALTTTQRQQVESYLNSKWAIY